MSTHERCISALQKRDLSIGRRLPVSMRSRCCFRRERPPHHGTKQNRFVIPYRPIVLSPTPFHTLHVLCTTRTGGDRLAYPPSGPVHGHPPASSGDPPLRSSRIWEDSPGSRCGYREPVDFHPNYRSEVWTSPPNPISMLWVAK